MNTDINIILPKNLGQIEHQSRIKAARMIAFIFPLIVGAVSLGIFLFIQSINPASIIREQDDVKSQISKLDNRKIKLFLVNNRVDNIKDLLQRRKDFFKSIDTVLTQMPDDLLVDTMDMDNKIILLTITSPSLSSVDQFLNNLIVMAKKKELISSLTLNSLTFDETKNNYLVSLKSEF